MKCFRCESRRIVFNYVKESDNSVKKLLVLSWPTCNYASIEVLIAFVWCVRNILVSIRFVKFMILCTIYREEYFNKLSY